MAGRGETNSSKNMFSTHPSRHITLLRMFLANRLILEILLLHSLCLFLETQLREISLLESISRSEF